MKQRIYIDTSVIGGVFDEEFQRHSNMLMDEFKAGIKIAVVSDVTFLELADAPERVQAVLSLIPNVYKEDIALTTEARELADKYISAGAVTMKFYEDALHIAIATVSRVDILASWNFKHIVNLDRIRKFNAVNLINGYPMLEIRSPREILKSKEDE
ncbi:MAG: PIN domain protein [Saprospiraceae bacterium]|nr:PIN domain protein [Saprospiraceae bacterium]